MRALLPAMIDEMFRIVLDPIYPPSQDYVAQATSERVFELIYQEAPSTSTGVGYKNMQLQAWPY